MHGVANEAIANSEMVIVADLDLALLDQARKHGSVHNHLDAANDMTRVAFNGQINVHERRWVD
jgi:predicted amidohydrolase